MVALQQEPGFGLRDVGASLLRDVTGRGLRKGRTWANTQTAADNHSGKCLHITEGEKGHF